MTKRAIVVGTGASLLATIVSACGSFQPPTSTPTPVQITNLSEGYATALDHATALLGQKETAQAILHEVTSYYDVTATGPSWTNAVFFFVTYEGSEYGAFYVSVGRSGVVTTMEYEGQIPFAAPIEEWVVGGMEQRAVLPYAWENLGGDINANCGPVARAVVRLNAYRQPASTELTPLWRVSYDNGATITLMAGATLETIGKDPACPGEGSAPSIVTQAAREPGATNTPHTSIEYTVQPGDTCDSIAFAHQVTRSSLTERNALPSDCGRLEVGQTLVIP